MISLYCYYEDFQDRVRDRLGIQEFTIEPEVLTWSTPMFFSPCGSPNNWKIADKRRIERNTYADFEEKIKERLDVITKR